VTYEWDAAKAHLNTTKHGVRFSDAVSALEDDRALTRRDVFSDDEERWITIAGHVRSRGRRGLYVARQQRSTDFGAIGNTWRTQTVSGESMKREYDFSKAKRGPVVAVPKTKEKITIRLDREVIDWFRAAVDRAGGGNYQSLINEALRGHVARSEETLEKTLRRVIREEIRRGS
jgi:uncharacterized protein (DUF4415 family)